MSENQIHIQENIGDLQSCSNCRRIKLMRWWSVSSSMVSCQERGWQVRCSESVDGEFSHGLWQEMWWMYLWGNLNLDDLLDFVQIMLWRNVCMYVTLLTHKGSTMVFVKQNPPSLFSLMCCTAPVYLVSIFFKRFGLFVNITSLFMTDLAYHLREVYKMVVRSAFHSLVKKQKTKKKQPLILHFASYRRLITLGYWKVISCWRHRLC